MYIHNDDNDDDNNDKPTVVDSNFCLLPMLPSGELNET